MVYVIKNSDVLRGHAGRDWVLKGLIFTGCALGAGLLVGAALGWAGGEVAAWTATYVAIALGVAAVIVGAAESAGLFIRIPERNCEVRQSAMGLGALTSSAYYGAVLGIGASSRIGFPLWYAVPSAAFLAGSPGAGAAIYAAYSGVRGVAPWVVIAASTLAGREAPRRARSVEMWALRQNVIARRLAGVPLVVLGIAAVTTGVLQA